MNCCARRAGLRQWISQAAICIAARLSSWRADRGRPSSTSRARRCRRGDSDAGDARTRNARRDPGYHLIGAGRRAFEATVGYRAPRWSRAARFTARGAGEYIAAIAAVAAIVLMLPLIEIRAMGCRRLLARTAGAAGYGSVNRRSRRSSQPRHHPRTGRDDPPRPCAARRHPPGSADHGRGAHAADDARSNRGAHRAPRDPLSRLRRMASCTSRCSRTGPMRRRSTPQKTRRLLDIAIEGIARLNHLHGAGSRGRPLRAAPSAAGLERGTKAMDGLGAQARQTARVEPAAARRAEHDFHRCRRPAACHPTGRTVRRHAGCRYPPAARCRAASGRQDGSSVESAQVRCGERSSRRRLRGTAATRRAVSADGLRRLALSARVLECGRNRSLRSGGLRRVPGSLRPGLLCRQRNL